MRDHSDPMSTTSARRRRRAASAVLSATAMLGAAGTAAATPLMYVETVMAGLLNPRGLTFGPDGALYVAEAGSGGTGPTITTGNDDVLGYGATGAISRLQNGTQERLVSDLPSFAGPSGEQAHGPQDLTFGADGRLYATMGLGANPAELTNVASENNADLAGKLVVIEGGVAQVFADIPAFEVANDPDGAGPDSNAYSVVPAGDGFYLTDAGANAVVSVDATGAVALEALLPFAVNPLFPFGPPNYQPVPTGAALGPDGSLYFGQLTGFPFMPGAAQIFSFDDGTLSVIAGGLTNIIDVAFDANGSLFALELDSDGLLGPGATGSIFEIALDGTTEQVFSGLDRPTGLAIGPDGSFFVSVGGFSTNGSVARLAPVPLPAAMPTMAGVLALLTLLAQRRSRRRS